jgi:putative endonuclease
LIVTPGDHDRDASTRARGFRVEARVADHLRAHGLEILESNVSIGGAELDLIARDDRGEPTIVFIEVRSRASVDLGHPLETVDADKQRRLVRGATAYLVAHGLWERVAVRFDVVAVVDPEGAAPEISWITAAFEP